MGCIKRQRILRSGEEEFRCINPASQHHGQTVSDVCDACPVKVLLKKRPCKRRKEEVKSEPPLSDKETIEVLKNDFNVPVSEEDIKKYPPLYTQMLSYKEALKKWVKAGKPTRTQEQVDQIVEDHCKKCDWYDKEAERCKGCGCRVSNSSIAIVNKVKMATEHCPKGLW